MWEFFACLCYEGRGWGVRGRGWEVGGGVHRARVLAPLEQRPL